MRACLHGAACLIAAVLFLILTPAMGLCGTVEVRPTLLAINPSQHIAILTLQNQEARQAVYQLRAYRWTQKGDEQVLDPTDDIIASPPMVTLPAHATQIIRVGLRAPDLPAGEQTYRLIMEEVAVPDVARSQGLNIALRLSLPLFVRPESDAPNPTLAAQMRMEGGKATVTVHNNGPYTTRIVRADLDIHGGDDNKLEVNRLTYILPGAWADFSYRLAALPPGFHGGTLTVQTDEGAVDIETPLATEAMSHGPVPAAP